LETSEAPKSAPSATAARSGCHSPRLAKLGDRFNAFVLDTVVLFGVFAVADAWILMRWSVFEKSEWSLSAAALLAVMVANTVILFLYTWIFEASCGATLGKVVVGIRVVRTGRRGALSAAAIRNLLRIVDGMGLYLVGAIVAGCSPWKQRLGDLSAGTTVVENEFGTVSKILAVSLAAAVLGGAGWGVPRICAQPNAAQPTQYLSQVVVRVGRTDTTAYFRVARLRFDVQIDPTSAAPVVR